MSQVVTEKLDKLTKPQLIDLVEKVIKENTDLIKERDELLAIKKYMEESNKRLIRLERNQNEHLQYTRRDTIEITGIPKNIKQDDLEDEVIKIFEAANVSVGGERLSKIQIQAVHRIGKAQEKTVAKFVNRRFASEAMYASRNLKDNSHITIQFILTLHYVGNLLI